jgi:hypothetical protein
MSEANVEIIRRHYEIRHGKGGKRREVGMDDWQEVAGSSPASSIVTESTGAPGRPEVTAPAQGDCEATASLGA